MYSHHITLITKFQIHILNVEYFITYVLYVTIYSYLGVGNWRISTLLFFSKLPISLFLSYDISNNNTPSIQVAIVIYSKLI